MTHTNNLLAIEQDFLSNTNVRASLKLTVVRGIQRTMDNAQKKKFADTLQLSGLVATGFDWFKTDGKALLAESGLEWTTEDFALKVYGWKKSYFHKVVKAGKLEQEVVDTFNAKCDELEARGEDPNRTLEGLLKYAKMAAQTTEGGGEEGEGGGEEAQPESRQKAIVTFAFKVDGRSVACRVMSDGTLKTTNTSAELTEAIGVLLDYVRVAQGQAADNPMQDHEDRLEWVMDAEEGEDVDE